MKRLFSFCSILALMLCFGISACADLMNAGGTLKYYDEYGRESEELGLDVSFYNNQIDFKALADQGFTFVIVRLGGRGWGSGGVFYGDDRTWSNLHDARNAGLKIGAYFYSTAINVTEAVEEAAMAIQILNGFSLDLPLYIDMEYSGNYPYGRADRLSPGQRADIASAFCRAVEASGYSSGIYASEGYVRFDIDTQAISYLPLWMASYTVDNRLPQYIQNYSIWQQTDSAFAGGIDGSFDLNIVLP